MMTTNGDAIEHSVSGREWKKHKYVKKIGNTYYYDKKAYERDLKKLENQQKTISAEKQYLRSNNTYKRTTGDHGEKILDRKSKKLTKEAQTNYQDLQKARQYSKTMNDSKADYNTFTEALIKKDISGDKSKKEAEKRERQRRIETERKLKQERRRKAWEKLHQK